MKTLSFPGTGRIILMLVFALFFTQCDKASYSSPADNGIDARGGKPITQDLCTCLSTTLPKEDLSNAEIEALMYMREEEKLARDIYLHFTGLWDTPVFSHIATSEQRHMDAVLCLVNKYDLTDPVGDNGMGVFENATLHELYNTLISDGETGLKEALTVGARIEDLDIYDLMQIVADQEVDNADINTVFDNLMRGSRNHLRAFTSNLETLGVTYTPQYITQEIYAAILAGDWETGNGLCGFCNGSNSAGGNGPHNRPGNGNGSHFGPGAGTGTGICPWGNDPPHAVPPHDGKRNRG